MQLRIVMALLFASLITVFALQNPTTVTLRFVQFELQQVSFPLTVLLTAVAAAAITMLVGIPGNVAKTVELRDLRTKLAGREAQVKKLEAELAQRTAGEPPGPTDTASAP